MTPIGRPDLQRLHGIAVAQRKQAVFFSLMHYTPQAIEWANEVGIALFRYDLQGDPDPVNRAAEKIMAAAPGIAPSTVTSPIWMYPLRVPDQRVLKVIQKEAKPRFRGRETINWIKQVWLVCYSIQINHTMLDRKQRVAQIERHILCDSFDGKRLALNDLGQTPTIADPETPVMPPRIEPADVQRQIIDLWNRYVTLTQAAARQRYASQLSAYAVDPQAKQISVSHSTTAIWPVYAALLSQGLYRRVITVDGVTGLRLPDLDRIFTSNLTYVADELADAAYRSVPLSAK